MAEQKALVIIGGAIQQLPSGDTLGGVSGGGVVELATITVPGLSLDWMQDVARPGVTTANTVQCWFAPTTADDENELDWMGGMTIFAEVTAADVITFCWSSPTPEIGAFKVNFIVR